MSNDKPVADRENAMREARIWLGAHEGRQGNRLDIISASRCIRDLMSALSSQQPADNDVLTGHGVIATSRDPTDARRVIVHMKTGEHADAFTSLLCDALNALRASQQPVAATGEDERPQSNSVRFDIWVQFADDGIALRKWDRKPFAGGIKLSSDADFCAAEWAKEISHSNQLREKMRPLLVALQEIAGVEDSLYDETKAMARLAKKAIESYRAAQRTAQAERSDDVG